LSTSLALPREPNAGSDLNKQMVTDCHGGFRLGRLNSGTIKLIHNHRYESIRHTTEQHAPPLPKMPFWNIYFVAFGKPV
jgi:hypothetical protein